MEKGLYVCGMMYRKGDKEEFGLVRPTGGLPYLADESECWGLYQSCAHHSCLYRLSEDLLTATLASGEGAWAPKKVTLALELVEQLRQAVGARAGG